MTDGDWVRWGVGLLLALIFGSYAYTYRSLNRVWDVLTKIQRNELSHLHDLEDRMMDMEHRLDQEPRGPDALR